MSEKVYYKITLLGEQRVGKTTLRRSYMGKSLDKTYLKTIGVDFAVKTLNSGAFQIWDIAGEATPKTIRSYIRGSSGLIILFDVMNYSTLNKLVEWIDIVREELGDDLVAVLVGNKIDLRTEFEGLHKEDATDVIDIIKNHFGGENSNYMETSAITGEGVQELFEWMFETLSREVN